MSGTEGGPFQNPFWSYDLYDQSTSNSVFELVTRLNRFQAWRRETNIRCMRLYGGSAFMNLSPYSYMRAASQFITDERPKYNVITSCTDTVYSRVCKNKPRIMALTERGDDALRRRAQKLSQYTLGMMKHIKGFEICREVFRDSLLFDIGCMKVWRDGGKIRLEKVFSNEIYIDETDAFYGSPSHIHQVKYILKDRLKAQFPKDKHIWIDQAAGVLEGEGQFASNTDTRYAVVIESWHLASGEDANDGRHTISVSNQVLFDEKYEEQEFPFLFSRWTKPLVGFWGQSLAYRLMGKQLEINKLLKTIQDSFHLGSTFKVFLEHNSRVVQEHLSNSIGAIVYYTGTKPEYTVPQTVHPEYFQHLKWLIESSYQEAGISTMSAQGKKPAGLDAAVAMREFQDIESERFAVVAQEYDELHLELVKRIIKLSKQAKEAGEQLEVKAESKKFVETIKWKDVEVEENEVVLQLFPTAMLPHEPAGRVQFVTELMQSNLIDQDVGLSLLDFPDVQAALDVRLAPVHDIEFTIEKILDESEYNPPEPYQNLELGLKLFQSHYLKARADGVPEAKLQMLRDWMNSADALMQKKAAEQQMASMATQAGAATQNAQMPNEPTAPVPGAQAAGPQVVEQNRVTKQLSQAPLV